MNPGTVLFIATSSNASPARGGRRRIVDVAHQAARFGLSSRILCFLPFEQVARGLSFWRAGKANLQNEVQAPVTYWPMLPLTRFGVMEKFNVWYCGLITALLCFLHKVSFAYGHGLRAAQIALSAKRLRNPLRIIADIHGAGAAEYAYQKQNQPGDKIHQRLVEVEELVLTQADQLIFVSHSMHRYYERKFARSFENYAVIPCAINSKFQVDSLKREHMRRDHNLLDKLVVAYAGSAAPYQLVGEMCSLFKAISQQIPTAHFLILSHHQDQFQQYLDQHQIHSDDYSIFSVDHKGVFDMLQMGDVALMLRDNAIVNIVASPTKFAEYLLCGLPVITSPYVGDYSSNVNKYKLGYTVDLSNMSFVDGVISFMMDVLSKRDDYARRCINFVINNLHWDIFGEKLSHLIIGSKPPN